MPRTAAGPHAELLQAGQAKETSPAKPDPNVADPPSQPPSISVLRRPPDSTQYVSIRYTERLLGAGIEPSVGSVGDSYDNALAETVIGLFKTEVIRRRGPWRNLEAVEFATLEWVDWFNNRRLLEPIGNIPPAEAEARYYAAQQEIALAA
jgi:transposase InsO family protein